MKILKNVFAGIGILMILIATVVIIFFCGFAAGMDFKDDFIKRFEKLLNKDKNKEPEFGRIVFDSKEDAEAVVNEMKRCLEEYGEVSILDMEDISGIVGDYGDSKYGWFCLKGTRIAETKEGNFVINFPKAVPLE